MKVVITYSNGKKDRFDLTDDFAEKVKTTLISSDWTGIVTDFAFPSDKSTVLINWRHVRKMEFVK